MSNMDALADSIFLSFKAYCNAEVARRMKEVQPLAGPPGPQGERGLSGDRGVQGERGEAGERGEHGAHGLQGEQGDAGAQGERGPMGEPGQMGERGLQGEPGEPGAQGERGERGVGIVGPQGMPGERGEKGDAGAQGEAGPQGVRGEPGLIGKDGAPGSKGEDGRDGRDGLEGAPGRDALRLEVLESIDVERSYPRGTYAKHLGGLVRAVRTTDPLTDGELGAAGWQIIVEGVYDLRFEQLDERTSKLALVLTSGRKVEHVMATPVMIYRGVWTNGDFKRGDTVTHEGSLWHCQCDTDAQPGTSGDWKLAAKRGERGSRDAPARKPNPVVTLGTR